MTTLIDTKKFIRPYLATNAALVSGLTVGGKLQVFGPPGLPVDWSPAKAIEYRRAPSRQNQDIPIDYTTFHFRCYGKTAQEAETVWQLLQPLVCNVSVTEVTSGAERASLQYAHVIDYDDMEEPAPLNWPFVFVVVSMHWVRIAR